MRISIWPLTGDALPARKGPSNLHDDDEVKLGNATLIAHITPGHTKGCTIWTMKVVDHGRAYDVVIVGSPNVNPRTRFPKGTAKAEDPPVRVKPLVCSISRIIVALRSMPMREKPSDQRN